MPMFENEMQTRCAICGTGLVLARVVDPLTVQQVVGGDYGDRGVKSLFLILPPFSGIGIMVPDHEEK